MKIVTIKGALDNLVHCKSITRCKECKHKNLCTMERDYNIIKKDLEVLEQLEILKKYYPPFKEFLEEMFEKGYNEDLTRVKEWLENE